MASSSAYFRRVSSRLVDALLANPAGIKRVLFPSSSETVIDDEVLITIGEGYHHLETLLAPLDFITQGGTPIGDIAVGDGPARGLDSAQVRKVAGALAPISGATLRERFNTAPLPADAPAIAELVESFDTLRSFVIETAKAEAGMIIYLG